MPSFRKRGHIVLLMSVMPMSVCSSFRLSVRHTFVFTLYLEPLVGFLKKLCTNVKYDESMCSVYVYVWPRLVQGQGCKSRLNIVWLYFVSALYLLNPWWDFQITLYKCQVWWVDVQCKCLTKLVQGSITLTSIITNFSPFLCCSKWVSITSCVSLWLCIPPPSGGDILFLPCPSVRLSHFVSAQ